jgi:hypothetical protein
MLEVKLARIIPIVLLVSAPLAYAQKTQEIMKLEVSVRSLKSTYSINENLQIDIQLTNTGTNPILINRDLGWGIERTYVRVYDEKGKEVYTNFLPDEVPPPPLEKAFVEIREDEFYGERITDSLKHFVNTPGTYELYVEYTSTVSEKWAHKYLHLPIAKLWTIERGKIVSNRIRITVTE